MQYFSLPPNGRSSREPEQVKRINGDTLEKSCSFVFVKFDVMADIMLPNPPQIGLC